MVLVLNMDGELYSITEFQHVKPGKGPAFVRTKLKGILKKKTERILIKPGALVKTQSQFV
ncbi:MAG: hypothetical protein BalsKO_12670 [Balneolaceae bacterium]